MRRLFALVFFFLYLLTCCCCCCLLLLMAICFPFRIPIILLFRLRISKIFQTRNGWTFISNSVWLVFFSLFCYCSNRSACSSIFFSTSFNDDILTEKTFCFVGWIGMCFSFWFVLFGGCWSGRVKRMVACTLVSNASLLVLVILLISMVFFCSMFYFSFFRFFKCFAVLKHYALFRFRQRFPFFRFNVHVYFFMHD